MKYFKKLEGRNVFLSPINPEDLEVYTKWMNDISICINLGNASTNYSLQRENEMLEKLSKDDHNFAMVLKEGVKLIGNCSLFSINQIHRSAELGLFIGEEEYRGKGYGSEAVELLLCYGFKILNLNNIMLKVFSFNTRAIKAYEKVGFRVFGKRTGCYYVNDRYYDELYMEILSKDFKSDLLDEKLPEG